MFVIKTATCITVKMPIVTIVNTQHDCRLMEVTPAKKNSTENYL